MIDPVGYLTMIETALVTSPVVAEYTLVRTWANADDGYIRARITLVNGDFVETAEYFVVDGNDICTVDYRHQWMDGGRTLLRRRWDNAPHHATTNGSPHHVHLSSSEYAVTGEPMGILQVLQVLEAELGSHT